MQVDPRAGKPAERSALVNVPRLVSAYYTRRPDVSVPAERVSFGTSGHRGSSLNNGFNEAHILAISQAICMYRRQAGIDGPLFMGMDTHALSEPALITALEVFAANGVDVMLDHDGGYTPTPVISHAILTHNRGGSRNRADGVVVTPSHNPPEDGGFKYNPPDGGPADTQVTAWIERRANDLLAGGNVDTRRVPYEKARAAPTTHMHNYLEPYVTDLGRVIDMEAISDAGLHIGVDPMGGSGLAYWGPIAETYKLDIEVVNDVVDPTFAFMPLDRDGKIRMDCSSPFAMAGLIHLRDRFDIAFANDTDYDRHGIVTRGSGLLNPNDYLAVAVWHLFGSRRGWGTDAAIGKTVVSSGMIDRVAARLGRQLIEVPVGFKWFVGGLLDGSLGFGGEESAGASFLRREGSVWTTDKDGFILDLLAAEITAKTGKDPGGVYREITRQLGESVYERIDAPATPEEKSVLRRLSVNQVSVAELAGDKIRAMLTQAPGNNAPIGGLKVVTDQGWFAARPSGTENVYKIYAESFRDRDHLKRIQEEAQEIVARALIQR